MMKIKVYHLAHSFGWLFAKVIRISNCIPFHPHQFPLDLNVPDLENKRHIN